jgi:hypothetical protein
MTNNKHTPGPWIIVCRQKTMTNVQSNKTYQIDDYSICSQEVQTMPLVAQIGTNKANAQLIAAAPELLEALEHLSKELCDGKFVKHSPDAILKIKSAIAKARG